MGNNPIIRIDPNGMEWGDEESKKRAKEMESQIKNTNASIEKQTTRIEGRKAKAEAKGNTDRVARLDTKISNNDDRIETNNGTITALHDINDKVGMKFVFGDKVTTSENSAGVSISKTTFSRNLDGTYVINNSGSLGNQAHEVTHGAQIARGLVDIAKGSTSATVAPGVTFLQLETDGYKARYGIDGSVGFSVKGISDPNFSNKLFDYLKENAQK